MSHLPLDARAILHYLNELGYRNISATQLKEFLKDLRKLIKYEERMGVNNQQDDYYQSLYRRTTASYRAKIDKENIKRKSMDRRSCDTTSSSNTQPELGERKVLGERNNKKANTSYDLFNSFNSTKNPNEKKTADVETDSKSLKILIEKILRDVLHDKYSPEFKEKYPTYTSKENSPIRSIVEQVVKDKLDKRSREKLNTSESGSLKSIIEDLTIKILDEKYSSLQKQNVKPLNSDGMKDLNRDIHQKLFISKAQNVPLPRETSDQYNSTKSLNSQSLVEQLLAPEETANEKIDNQKAEKSKGIKQTGPGGIKRLPRSARKKPEWQDPTPNDKILDKNVKGLHTESPAASSSARSGRSKCGSSVLIRRSKSQGRKPNSDPVALYQYYKNEWEHFRKQIPGESPHSRLRWHVRQRLLDSE